MLISVWLHENIYRVSVLVDGAPEILPLTLDCYEEFVQAPDVAQATLPAPEYMGVFGTEFRHHCRMVSQETMILRCASRYSTSRKLNDLPPVFGPVIVRVPGC
jgi:hypothetical protein